MEEASKAKDALKKALTFEQQKLERDMKESEDEIQRTLKEWQKRKKEVQELEESIKFKEVVRAGKIAINGRGAAAEMLKYGSSAHDQAFVEAARKLLDECNSIDGELSAYFGGNEKHYAMFQATVDREDREKGSQTRTAAGRRLASERML